jgi:hypothetical protein
MESVDPAGVDASTDVVAVMVGADEIAVNRAAAIGCLNNNATPLASRFTAKLR